MTSSLVCRKAAPPAHKPSATPLSPCKISRSEAEWKARPTDTDNDGPGAMVGALCYRCGSPLGHIVIADRMLLHCINGASLTFTSTCTWGQGAHAAIGIKD